MQLCCVWRQACYLTWQKQTETAGDSDGVCVFNPLFEMFFSPLFSQGFPLCVNSKMRNAGNVVPPPLWPPRVGHRLYASQFSPMSPLLGNPVEFFTTSKWKRGTSYSCCQCDLLYNKVMAIYTYGILGMCCCGFSSDTVLCCWSDCDQILGGETFWVLQLL